MMRFREQETPPDVLAVLRTAGLLSISEFHVFRLAYTSWYGYEADEETLEASFTPYMFGDRVPSWVRSFTRMVLRLESEGQLDPRQFGIPHRILTPQELRQGWFYILGLMLALVLLLVLTKVSVQWLDFSDCYFPPCY